MPTIIEKSEKIVKEIEKLERLEEEKDFDDNEIPTKEMNNWCKLCEKIIQLKSIAQTQKQCYEDELKFLEKKLFYLYSDNFKEYFDVSFNKKCKICKRNFPLIKQEISSLKQAIQILSKGVK